MNAEFKLPEKLYNNPDILGWNVKFVFNFILCSMKLNKTKSNNLEIGVIANKKTKKKDLKIYI